MSVAVCTLGCDRKAREGFPSWPHLFALEGDYTLYINYEADVKMYDLYTADFQNASRIFFDNSEERELKASFDVWGWGTPLGLQWRNQPKFDQDQARLASIVTARNMCIEYAYQTGASHLLFIDADIIPPKDIIPKMLEVNHDAVCGLVYGRGVHAASPYIFQEKRRWRAEAGYELVEVEHANIGFTMLSRRLFEAVRFRYGETYYSDGNHHCTSDDPAYHADCYRLFGEWPWVRMDVVGQHIGDLKANEVSQF